jgi:hypothetical protein
MKIENTTYGIVIDNAIVMGRCTSEEKNGCIRFTFLQGEYDNVATAKHIIGQIRGKHPDTKARRTRNVISIPKGEVDDGIASDEKQLQRECEIEWSEEEKANLG